ncbi:uncharacterized protein LOC124285536 [Haliotis rubra]|uniref:uncharacterized protein LOC124285536 n=1 Tax=Haliotis rubra TaxID=36100 RepID=UPI001EE5046E|nr:uncharacterized protein LOC124285536 [Haliotis rubra]
MDRSLESYVGQETRILLVDNSTTCNSWTTTISSSSTRVPEKTSHRSPCKSVHLEDRLTGSLPSYTGQSPHHGPAERFHRITMHGRCLLLMVLLVQSACFYQLVAGTLPSHDHVEEHETTTTEPVTDLLTTTTEHVPDPDLIQ